ncbi:hypothetical protein TrVFT333_011346 [Trichoderma virens FT-333]|nr:hypothetical protein TrVFT333_011346 [Trichoderma virens FT-333]
MVRGRTTGRGAGRGSAAASSRSQTEGADDSNQQSFTGSAAPTANMGLAESSTDQGASSQPAASTVRRGAASTRASRAAASTGRFRPKNIRRDESERDALAQQEQQKASDRAADERRARGRSRFRSKRSRGDAMGSRGGGFGRPVAGASGPFSSGMGGPGGAAGGGWFGAGGGGGGGSFARTGKFEAKPGSGFGFASEGRFRETRINADKLHTMAHDDDLDSEDEAMLAALHSRSGSVMPMGILRREHKEAPVVVATTAELEAAEKALAEEESLWVDGEAPESLPPADQPEEGDWNTSAKRAVKVKKEPTDDTMDLDVDVKPTTDEGKLPVAKMKAKKAAAQDPEENMIRTDLSLLASELGAITINGDGEEKGDEAGCRPQPRIKVKEEEQHSTSLHATPLSASSTATPVDLTQQGEDEDEESDDEDEEQERRNGFRSQALSNGGLIGRLNVRKSGKVELDWGGRILEMSPAAGMNFLTTAVIVEESDEKPQNGVTTGESIGMGKIMGRFVLAPIWNEEEDWEVAPEELDIGAMNTKSESPANVVDIMTNSRPEQHQFKDTGATSTNPRSNTDVYTPNSIFRMDLTALEQRVSRLEPTAAFQDHVIHAVGQLDTIVNGFDERLVTIENCYEAHANIENALDAFRQHLERFDALSKAVENQLDMFNRRLDRLETVSGAIEHQQDVSNRRLEHLEAQNDVNPLRTLMATLASQLWQTNQQLEEFEAHSNNPHPLNPQAWCIPNPVQQPQTTPQVSFEESQMVTRIKPSKHSQLNP